MLKVGDDRLRRPGGRTNAEGIRQLRGARSSRSAPTSSPYRSTKVLHLKSAVTALPDGTVIGYPPLVDDPARLAALPAGARGVRLARRRCSATTGCSCRRPPRARPSCSPRRGYTPVAVDISEFEKLEGCVTCLSVRLRTPTPLT